MFFWINRKKITTGRAVMMAPAISGPQNVWRGGLVVQQPGHQVLVLRRVLSVLMMMNSFQAWMKP